MNGMPGLVSLVVDLGCYTYIPLTQLANNAPPNTTTTTYRRLFGENQEARLARLAKAEAEAEAADTEDHFALAADYQTVGVWACCCFVFVLGGVVVGPLFFVCVCAYWWVAF